MGLVLRGVRLGKCRGSLGNFKETARDLARRLPCSFGELKEVLSELPRTFNVLLDAGGCSSTKLLVFAVFRVFNVEMCVF